MNTGGEEHAVDAVSDIASLQMDFDQAVAYVSQHRKVAFSFTPVFEEDDEAAAGGRLFVLVPETGGYHLHYLGGPFFFRIHMEDEFFAADEIPPQVKEMKFLPSIYREGMFDQQLQDVLKFLMEHVGR